VPSWNGTAVVPFRGVAFPADYRFEYGTRRDRVRMLGNGVCPPVMEAIVRHLTA
jgi:DNA (cytosine-5)-methyltransferase 1